MVKICGIKTPEDALAAAAAGADYLGFNFHRGSPRWISPEHCAAITAVLKQAHPGIKLVGVFVNSPAEEVERILEACSLDLAQLHGDESAGTLARLAPRAFKAFRGIPEDVNGFARSAPPALLLDASAGGAYGGTGLTADWAAAAGLARQLPLFLAGGLTPLNVAEALRQVRPWGVDVASGVEAGPGGKHAGKMMAFVQAVRKGSP
jgi:phosphoribosylanthranilate isomerase